MCYFISTYRSVFVDDSWLSTMQHIIAAQSIPSLTDT